MSKTRVLIVDDAIIDPENIRRRLAVREGEMDSETKTSLIVEAASEMRGPIVFAFLVLLLMLLASVTIPTWGCGGGRKPKDDWVPPMPKAKPVDDAEKGPG